MWTVSLLKRNARAALHERYWSAWAVCLVWMLASGYVVWYFTLNGFIYLKPGHGVYRPNIGPAYYTVLALSVLLLLAFRFLVANVLTVGAARYMMEGRQGFPPFSTLLSGFSSGWRNIVLVMARRDITVALWGLLAVVPGVYRAYQYRLVPYLLAENPEMPAPRALTLSRACVSDEILHMIGLDVSLIGWFILGTALLLVGNLFVVPYYAAVWAEFYAAARAKMFARGLSREAELSGFVSY